MRSKFAFFAAALAGLLVVPQFAVASDDVEEQLRLMSERMQSMEQQLQATQDELDASKEEVSRQSDVIGKAGLDREAKSGLSSFFSAVEISGWVAASWWWNFNSTSNTAGGDGIDGDPALWQQNIQNYSNLLGNGTNSGASGLFNPFHPDHNSFSVDQVWFEIEKPVTEESRGGFRLDLTYGRTASILGTGDARLCGDGGFGNLISSLDGGDLEDVASACQGDNASDFYMYQAYVQYLVPGLEATMKAGKFETITGAEVAGTVYNMNVTRGFLYTAFQPITHYGILVDKEFENGLNFAIGGANDFAGIDPDYNNGKHLLASVGYGAEMFSGKVALVWGPENLNDTGGQNGLLDFVFTVDPSDRFSAWLNADYAWNVDNQEAWGVALAGRVAITDRAGFALRGEWAKDRNNYFGFGNGSEGDIDNTVVWTLTGTFDYALTDNLMVRAEVRWDTVDKRPGANNEFIKKKANVTDLFTQNGGIYTNQDQVIGGVEIVYEF